MGGQFWARARPVRLSNRTQAVEEPAADRRVARGGSAGRWRGRCPNTASGHEDYFRTTLKKVRHLADLFGKPYYRSSVGGDEWYGAGQHTRPERA